MKKIKTVITLLLIIGTVFSIGGCSSRVKDLNSNLSKEYASVFASYLPDGYEVEKETKLDHVNQVYVSDRDIPGSGGMRDRRYKVQYLYYCDANDTLAPNRNNAAIILDSLMLDINDGDKNKTVADAIKYSMKDAFNDYMRKEYRKDFYKYGTFVYDINFNVSDEDILKNKYNINLSNMKIEDFANVSDNITCKLQISKSTAEKYSAEELENIKTAFEKKVNQSNSNINFHCAIENLR